MHRLPGLLCLALSSTAIAQIPTNGLRIWLRADAGVSSTAGRVDAWSDQAGSGHTFQQTGNRRPYLLMDSTGANLLRFQRDEYLTASLPLTLQTATIFGLFRYRGPTSNNYLYAFGSPGSSGSQMTLSRRSRGRAYHYDGSIQNIQGSIPPARWVVSTQLYGASSAGSHELRIDGVTQITSSSAGYSADLNAARIGNWSSGSYVFRGDLAQLIVYDRVLTSNESTMVESWLAAQSDGARTMEYGAGCAGTSGTPRIRANAGSLPQPGTTFRTETISVPASTPVFALLGFDDTSFMGGATLPFSLAVLGVPQCSIYVSGDVVQPLTNQGGRAPWSLAIPIDPNLLRTCFHLQSILLDAGANAFGVTTTNALTATIGT